MIGAFLSKLVFGGVIEKFTSPLLEAYQAKLSAQNDEQRIALEHDIQRMENMRDLAMAEAGDKWSATRMGRWLIVVPFGVWWMLIFVVSILNPLFGLALTIDDIPQWIKDMAFYLVPAIVVADVGNSVARRVVRR